MGEKKKQEVGLVKIETNNGLYTIKEPVGKIGAIHFSILTRAIPTSNETDSKGNVILSPRDEERFSEGFVNWCEKVLKHIVHDGPYKYDDMPGEDQYAIFFALAGRMNVGEELFRIVE